MLPWSMTFFLCGNSKCTFTHVCFRYFLTRQSLDLDSKPTLQVLEQTSFAPLAKARFDIIGQDRVLDEFYRVIGLHSQRKSRNALVILLCGDSGHGKSFLAQKGPPPNSFQLKEKLSLDKIT